MNRILTAALLAALLGSTGCMTYRDLSKFNTNKRTQNALKVEAMRGAGGDVAGAWVGLDLLEVGTGYAAWWRECPGEAAMDTTIDLSMAALAALGTKVVYDWLQEDDVREVPSDDPTPIPPNFTVSGETVIVIIGDGSSGTGSTTAGGAE